MEQIAALSINHRVKQVRESLHLTQAQFSKIIALSGGYLAGVELEKRKVNDRLVKLICSSFNVREQWLRSGEGEMFQLGADEEFTCLAAFFKELKPQFRVYILKEMGLLLEMQKTDPRPGSQPASENPHGENNQ
jgi:transcriptional regulator with XRE-family HTH domain